MSDTVPPPARTFAEGARYLSRGFDLMRARPRLLVIGMIPAVVVFVVFLAAFVLLLMNVVDLASWLTPFADDWNDTLRSILRVCLAIAIVVGVVILMPVTFTGITLTVGDPFYEHIWRQCEEMLGPQPLGDGLGFWRSALDGLKLAAVGLGCSLIVLLSGFIPVIGPVLGICLGVSLSGRILARELLSRAFEARGLTAEQQRELLLPHSRAVWGFGITTQACFLVPLGGVLVMPTAVAGATAFAREVLRQADSVVPGELVKKGTWEPPAVPPPPPPRPREW